MPVCGYPQCTGEAEGGTEWCLLHMATTCRYPLQEPFCQEHTIPHSVYCLIHDRLTTFIMNVHGEVHKAAQLQMQAMQGEQKVQQAVRHVLFPGNGLRG